jgi:hypothetical protein
MGKYYTAKIEVIIIIYVYLTMGYISVFLIPFALVQIQVLNNAKALGSAVS